MNKKVKELIEATGVWVAICMKQYPDSRFVDDKLVRVCAALSAFENSKADKEGKSEKWIIEATTMFHRCRKESEKYNDVKELCLMYAGKATALLELLEKFGAEPKIHHGECLVKEEEEEEGDDFKGINKTEEARPLPCPFCGKTPTIMLQAETKKGAWGKIVCINPACPVNPEICDDRRVTDVEDPKLYKSVIISLWNKRAKC